MKGTYETGYTFSLGISPGIVAFATNNMAVEVNVGVMGITYTHTKQVHNQVTVGKRDASMMNFKVNIFSIGLGMAFYLLGIHYARRRSGDRTSPSRNAAVRNRCRR